jgi:chromosome segregation ATPase
LSEQLQYAQSNTKEFEQQVKGLEDDIRKFKVEFENRGHLIDEHIKEMDIKDQQLEKANNKIQSHRERLQKIKDARQKDMEAAQAAITELETREQSLLQKIEKLDNEVQRLQGSELDLQTDLVDAQAAFATQARLAANANARRIAVKKEQLEIKEEDRDGTVAMRPKKRRRQENVTEVEKENAIEID